jgi:hypothetical protein
VGARHREAHTLTLPGVSADAKAWTDDDVRRLLSEMLLAIERQKPRWSTAEVSLRGFRLDREPRR